MGALLRIASNRSPDIDLPDTDGFAVAAHLTSGPAVVLTSGRDARAFGPLVARCGARAFVSNGELSGPRLRELVP